MDIETYAILKKRIAEIETKGIHAEVLFSYEPTTGELKLDLKDTVSKVVLSTTTASLQTNTLITEVGETDGVLWFKKADGTQFTISLTTLLEGKQNKLTAGTNIEIKDDGTINCTAEGKTYTEGNGINISDTDQISADNTVVAFQNDIKYTNDTGCTVAVGGIAKGTTFNNKSVREILEDMLYPYVAFSGFSIATTDASGTFEYGTTKSITKVTPKFTKGSKNISSVKIGTTSGGSDLYSGTSATNNTAITLTTSTSWDGKASKTIYCTLSDGTTTDTKSATFTPAYYTYYKVTTSTTAPTSGCTKTNSTGSGDSTITTTNNSYIWFLTKNAKTKIQQYVTGQWNDMTTTSAGTVSLTLSSGQTVTYYAYRTDKMVAATSRYQIV